MLNVIRQLVSALHLIYHLLCFGLPLQWPCLSMSVIRYRIYFLQTHILFHLYHLALNLLSFLRIPQSCENHHELPPHIPANPNTQVMWHTSCLTMVERLKQAKLVKAGKETGEREMRTHRMRERGQRETRGMSFQLGAKLCSFSVLWADTSFPSHPPLQHVTHQDIWL